MAGTKVAYSAEGVEFVGTLFAPAGSGPAPGVLVAHESPGVTEHTLSAARRLAGLGFMALATDYQGGGQVVTAEQKTAFRRALRRAREAAGQTQSGLSLKIGVSRSAVWQWEEGRAVPTEENVAALERELQLQPGALSRLLGYLPAGAVEREMISVIEALEADPKLGERERELLASMYRQLLKQREAQGGNS